MLRPQATRSTATLSEPELLIACSERIDLWCSFIAEINEPVLLARYRALLSPSERAQAERFYFAKDRHRYLLTRALVRATLSRYVQCAPNDWEFASNAYGRPHIANELPAAAGLCFNLSHDDRLIVMAVTQGLAVGVDTENVHTRSVALEIADKFFAPAEVQELRRLPRAQQVARFFDYWTLKESYIKARGMGLSIPLDQFAFAFPNDGRGIALTLDARLGDTTRWRFWQLQVGDHRVALCAQRDSAVPHLMLRKTVPLQHDCALACRELRNSE